jgi:dihydrofolate reductase
MIVSMIAALDEASGIGLRNAIPWRLPDDLRRFKQLTLGHHILMGRKTFESIGRALPGRTTLVVTRNPAFAAPRVETAPSIEAALEVAAGNGEAEAFICGGGEIYAQALPLTQRLYLTIVHTQTPSDTRFPDYQIFRWDVLEISRHDADEKHTFAFTFLMLQRH